MKKYNTLLKGRIYLVFYLFFMFISFTAHSQIVIFSDDFETNQGWTLAGEFERDAPFGLGGEHGNPDPSSAYQGTYVLGTDLTGIGTYLGDYETGLSDREYYAISPVINCSGYENVTLKFQRWLNVEQNLYDHAYVDISTNGGGTWTNVWANGGTTITDNAWSAEGIDISAYADNNSTVQIRFAIGVTDGSWQYSGWNIDNFEIIGFVPTTGDYRSRATGNWNNTGTWQRYNGTSWINASDYPGQNSGAGNVIIRSGNTVTLNINPANSIGSLSLLGDLTVNNQNRALNISNDISILSGTLTLSIQNNRSTTLNIGGDFNMSGGSITEAGGGTASGNFIFNGSSAQTFTKTGGSILNTINFTVNGGSILDMGTSVLDGSQGTFTLSSGAGLITAHTEGISSSGAVGNIQIIGRSFSSGANYTYNGSSAQVTGTFTTTPTSATVNNLTINNSNGVSISNTLSVSNVLTLTSGVLKLGNSNLNITSTSTNAIQGATFNNANMVETDGSGYLIRPASTTWPIEFPVGSDGYYSPVTISAVSGGATGDIRIRTEADNTLGSNYLPRTWEAITSVTGKTLTTTFNYDAAETSITPTNIWVKPASGAWQEPLGTSSFGATSFTIASTTNITTTSTYWTAGLLPNTYFSYQTGSWSDPGTWTTDPGGTTQVGTTIPSDGDVVVILSGRTVTLPSDISSAALEININSGGILNMSIYSFTSGLGTLKGTGTLQLATINFPTATTNTFVDAGGGTTEYNNTTSFTLPAAQTSYNNLTINASTGVVCTQLSDITLNGNLLIKQGAYRINDNTSTTKLSLLIYGDVTVNSGAYINVGNGSTNSTTDPTSLTGGTAPFLNYYEQFHKVVINGNVTNNGTIKFTNLDHPQFNAFPPLGSIATSGAATVYFQGTSNSTILSNGTTDFYNIVLDKGTDQTYTLTVQSSAYTNFRIFGANTAATNVSVANPDIMKALWIRNGSMVLKGLCVIPSLTEGTVSGSEYYIPYNGSLVLSGIDVIVLNTADDVGEVNVAYGVSGTTGVNTTGADYQGMIVYGKLKVNNGYLSTRESAGLLYSSVASGQFEIYGGTIDTKQFRTNDGTTTGAAYRQTNGTFILRGRIVRPVAYSTIADLKSITGAFSTRVANGTDDTYGTFNLEFDENIFSMSGGTIKIYDASGTAGQQKVIDVGSSLANSSVTGGTIEILPQTIGDGSTDASRFLIWSNEAMYGNLVINRETGCATQVRVRTNPLTILNNFTITSGDFFTQGQNITIGGNLTVSTNGIYNSNATTIFNGTKNQIFTIDGTVNNGAAGLTNIVDNNTSDTLKLEGTQSSLTVQGTFDLNSGVFDDGGKTVYIAGNITSSGVHTGIGKIQLNGTVAQTIGGDGTGVFKNLELNNTNVASAPVSLTVNATINGMLTFSQDKLFDISTHKLTFGASASIVNSGNSRYIQTGGNAGDGGITKYYSSLSPSFEFPLGAPSTNHATAEYTPATITFNTNPTTFGSITVIPVGYEHPATTNKNRSLTYYWRVKSSGFTLGSATITHSYKYTDSDVVVSADVTENEYIAARYDISTDVWSTGFAVDVDETANIIGEPGSGSFLQNVSFIDGDYTTGDNNPTNPFGILTTYYSLQTGWWGSTNTWSTVSHTGPVAGIVPGAGDIVIIGDKDSVYLNTNNYTANTDVRNCAILKIETGAALDIGYNPGCNFALVLNHPNGNGNFRLTTSYNSGSTFAFPSGDFSDYNINLGTTELYSTNATAGTTYWLPNNVTSYGNLIISPTGGSNIIFPNNDLLIYGNLTTRGQNSESWYCPNWRTSNYPTAPTTPISKTITIDGDFYLQGGALIWYNRDNTGAQDFVIGGNLILDANTGIRVYTNGTNNSQSVSIGGSLINNSLAPAGGVNAYRGADFTNVPLTFFGPSDEAITNISGTPYTVLDNVTIDKGTSQSDTLTINIGGTLTTPTDGWLTLLNGTLKYSRTDPSSDFTISTNTPFTIPSTAGLYVDYTTTAHRDILIANTANPSQGDNSDLFLDGKLTIVNGYVYVGQTGGTTPRNNDIEYAGGGFSEIDMQGGSLMVNGQIRRNPSMAGGILKYSQSGGILTINGQNATTTNAKFEICNATSKFNMSGGEINIVRGGGGSTYGDFYLRPGSSNVAGGTINFAHNLNGNPQIYRLDANVPLYNITITGRTAATTANAEVDLMVNPLVLKGTLLLSNGNSILNTNNINVTIKGDFTNNGTSSSYAYGTNTTTFGGGTQQLNGSSITNFYNVVINPVTSFTLNNGNNVTINNDLTITTGTLACGNYAVNLKGNILNNSTYTESQYGVILNGTTSQEISGSGTFGRLEIDNSNGAVATSNITLNKNLALTNGILAINDYLLSFGENSSVEGTGFGTSKMITSNGVFSDQGISKVFGIVAAPSVSFTYPFGVSGKYTPVDITIDANATTGSIRINCVNDRHPAVIDPNNVLQYYWSIQSTGITSFSGSVVFNYLDGDVLGTETDYSAARIINNTWGFPGTVDESANTLTYYFTGIDNLGDEYTAGDGAAFPPDIPVFTSQKNGNWNDPTTWVQTAGTAYTLTGGPNGFIVIVDDTVTLNENYCHAYRTTINGEIRKEEPYYGHNLGTVDGSGTLYLENATIPAGKYDSFFSCSNNSTLEYGGTTDYTLIASLYSEIANLRFTGTGTRTLPDKDLIICNLLEIDGPTLDNYYNRKLTIKGEMILTSGAFNSGTGAGATVSFNGTSVQDVINFNGSNAFNNLEINNAQGLTLNSTIEVTGTLMLTDGLINSTSANILYISNLSVDCVTPTGGSSSSYVNGPLKKQLPADIDAFQFPIGNSSTLGNNLSLIYTEPGTLDWTVEYINPSSLNTYSSPLTAINDVEYWNVGSSSVGSSGAIVNIAWDPSSNLTPLMTQNGISDMRVSEHNGSNWTELATTVTTGSDNYNGSAETSSRVSIVSGSTKNYTLACVNVPKPRIRLAPTGPVCGDAGIPIELSSSYIITGLYSINYTEDGIPKTALTPASFPATLPTNINGGTYQLTGFTYEGGVKTGAVDATSVTVYAVPTTANAGPNQSICGGTSATLAANTPVTGTGQWSIVSGAGGTVVLPTSPTSTFNGTNGTTYTLRWTISNGSCTSTSDVVIAFPLLPVQPAAFTTSSTSVCQGQSGVVYTVPNDPSVTYTWNYTIGTGATINGTTNSVTVDFNTSATSGTLGVTATNGCGTSAARTINITVNPLPAQFNVTGGGAYCSGGTGLAVGLDGSQIGVNYVLYVDGNPAGSTVGGDGGVISFGDQTVAGNYTVIATSVAGSCTQTMIGSVNITINALPIVIDQTAEVCSEVGGENTSATIDLTALENSIYSGGASYTWYNDAGPAGPIADPTTVVLAKTVNGGAFSTTEDYYCVVSDGTCSNTAIVTYTIRRIPETGPQYHLPN